MAEKEAKPRVESFGSNSPELFEVDPGDQPTLNWATLCFEKAFGIKADTMLRMQAAYDLAQARMREREVLVDRVAT